MRWSPFLALTLVALLVPHLAAASARAQAFGPPMTVFGSIADSAGPVAEGVEVEAYVGEKVCGRGKTQFTGDGAGRVTVYYADVVSREQTAGCGTSGSDVRIKIGDRFAAQTVRWQAGPQQLDIVFGTATPVAIPTFTPTPTRTPSPTRPGGAVTPTPGGPTVAGGSGTAAASGTALSATGTPARGTPTVPGTIQGGLGSPSVPSTGGDDDDGGGFPVWAALLLVVAGIALVGGGVGFVMAQNRKDRDAA